MTTRSHAQSAQRSTASRPSRALRRLLAPRTCVLVCCGLLYAWLAFHVGLGPMDGGPDENVRALLPKAMIEGNLLPSGYDQEVIYGVGNWSYAFYPQMLGAYLSALLMKAAELIALPHNICFMCGRLASVAFSLIALYFASRIAEIAAKRLGVDPRAASLATTALMGFWPQYVFLSSYINNDIVALCGTVIVTYALADGLANGWRTSSALALSAGVTISALGYWNAYGFILVGIAIFCWTLFRSERSGREKLRLFLVAALPAAACVLPFLAVNVIRYGDLLGMSTFRHQYELWLAAGGEQLQFPYTDGLFSLLFCSDYLQMTWKSFIGYFGYMAISLPFVVYLAYTLATTINLASLGGHLRRAGNRLGQAARTLVVGVGISCLITVALSLYYTLTTDYQPQGRYVIYLLPPLMVGSALGLAARVGARKDAKGMACGKKSGLVQLSVHAATCLTIFAIVVAQYGWVGVK